MTLWTFSSYPNKALWRWTLRKVPIFSCVFPIHAHALFYSTYAVSMHLWPDSQFYFWTSAQLKVQSMSVDLNTGQHHSAELNGMRYTILTRTMWSGSLMETDCLLVCGSCAIHLLTLTVLQANERKLSVYITALLHDDVLSIDNVLLAVCLIFRALLLDIISRYALQY